MVVADLEAGIGTLTRLDAEAIDVVVVVVEPTPRSIDVAQRALAVATAQGSVLVVANKVADADDARRVRAAFPDAIVVPMDPVVDDADRAGRSPLDADGGAAIDAIQALVERIADVQQPTSH